MLRKVKCWVFGHDWNMMGLGIVTAGRRNGKTSNMHVHCINCNARPTDNDARKQWRKI